MRGAANSQNEKPGLSPRQLRLSQKSRNFFEIGDIWYLANTKYDLEGKPRLYIVRAKIISEGTYGTA